ncbi:MAG: Hsp20/alpha crystallin family protein [Nanoarchaeota archaeon]
MKRISDEMRRMQRRFNHWLRNFDENPWDFDEEDFSQYRKAWVDARELDDEYVIAVELPGVNKDNIEVNVEEDALTIKVEKKSETKEQEEESYMYSKNYSGFFRRIPLPKNADAEKIDAEYKSGVLKLRIPKKERKKKGKTIQIR